MKNQSLKNLIGLGVLMILPLAAVLSGCKSDTAAPASSTPATTQPAMMGWFGDAPKRSGAQMWADNCSRCHNLQPPQRYSSQQWAVIVHHMRSRADLTGEEERSITQFLQASH